MKEVVSLVNGRATPKLPDKKSLLALAPTDELLSARRIFDGY
jgi:hypothetical protein